MTFLLPPKFQNQYEDMQQVGDNVTIEIKKSDSVGI